jgi:ribose 5-phosphate isomerase B
MKVALGSDHGGFELKEAIKKVLDEMNIQYNDFGTEENISCDYSDYAIQVSEAVAKKDYDRGILVCGTGIGMSIAANKVRGVRAALVSDMFTAKVTREHNDSNVLCLGGRTVGPQIALEIVRIWLKTEFEGGRHQRRIDKFAEYEAQK